jgi:hypothetical protein
MFYNLMDAVNYDQLILAIFHSYPKENEKMNP